jgi:hypothetical protein
LKTAEKTEQRHRIGRRSKKTEQTVNALLKVIATGAPYVICCQAVAIHLDTFMGWRQTDPEFDAIVEQTAAKAALRLLGKIEKQADQNFAASSWILERRFPELFSRPEVQLNLIQQNNTTENTLSITMSSQEAKQIEAQAAPVRASVREMFAAYRPGAVGNGNGHRTVDIQAEPVEKEALPPIVRKEGDENSSTFWANFVSGTGERQVDKATAIYVVKTVVDEVCGAGPGNQALVAFRTDSVTASDVLCVIDRLCGGSAGQQLLQRKAGYVASS